MSLPNVSYCIKENEVHYNQLIIQPNNEIWYTSSDGNVVTPHLGLTPCLDADGNQIPHVSNTYENGKGIIKFKKDCIQINEDAFCQCTSLTEIAIPNKVTSIGASAFERCTSLTGITIPDKVTSIGASAFNSCSSLTGITIPNSVTSIGASAFEQCTSLTGITIPDSVTTIGDHTFEDCYSLTGITIPDSVTTIGNYAFEFCDSLSSIILLPETPPTLGTYAFDQIATNAVIYVPSESVDGYKSADRWSDYADIIQPIP